MAGCGCSGNSNGAIRPSNGFVPNGFGGSAAVSSMLPSKLSTPTTIGTSNFGPTNFQPNYAPSVFPLQLTLQKYALPLALLAAVGVGLYLYKKKRF